VLRVKAAFFSVTPPPPPGDTGEYLRWHLLDHMPEQYQLPGIVHAMRWIADGDYPATRIARSDDLPDVGNVVNYLVGDPVQQTHFDFMELGTRLAELGRFPERRPSYQLRMSALLNWYAAPQALISAAVVPFRPHRGVLLVIEEPTAETPNDWLQWLHTEHHPAVLDVAGVAGIWTYGSSQTWDLHPYTQGNPQYTTVIYLDQDPLATSKALTSLIEQRWTTKAVRPLFAGPLRTMTSWDVWPA
jgi:hypothetical protein